VDQFEKESLLCRKIFWQEANFSWLIVLVFVFLRAVFWNKLPSNQLRFIRVP